MIAQILKACPQSAHGHTNKLAMNSNSMKLLKKTNPYPQGMRCQNCLEMGHWSYECKGKRKYLHRSSRTSQLKKALQNQEKGTEVIIEVQKKKTKIHVRKKMRKEESSSSSDSSSSSSESSEDSSSSESSSSSSSSDSESDSSDSVSHSSSSSSSNDS